MSQTEGVRIDKWLWAARFFKSRSLAVAAINSRKVRCNGERVKPSRELKPGDVIEMTVGESAFAVIVQALAAQSRPAVEARRLYAEPTDSLG
ncbi:MAG: RNA-binding S4 domain-containing protein [Rhodocyclaceae bacterium]|nr:MAG: RNA-binding S4 domain-containing protein [Rhodocyclaceae bacterium]